MQIEVRHSVNFYDVLGGDKQINEEKLEDIIKIQKKEIKKNIKKKGKRMKE